MIKEISFADILPIWQNYLWKDRTSKIESHSAMLFKQDNYDIKNFSYKATYFGYYINDAIVGVNSGHLCSDNSYRSRGLFVFPNYRNMGIGTNLLIYTIRQAQTENAIFVWSYPKKASWSTYNKSGFILASGWHDAELGTNAYCIKQL